MISLPLNLGLSGFLVLFFYCLFGSLGLPGGTIIIIFFGAIATNFSSLVSVILFVYIASVIGDLSAYWLARKFSNKLKNKLMKLSFFSKSEPRTRALLLKYGFYIVFITRFFFVGLCQVISYVSGFEKMNKKKFVLAVVVGEFLFAVIFSLMGFFIGETISNLISAVNYLVIAIVLAVLLYYIIRFFMKRKRISLMPPKSFTL